MSWSWPVWRRAVPLVLLGAASFYCLYFLGLTASGVLGPDEARYAAIGREMARSGDWVTPRLWGEAWLEKPALIYWMTGLGFRAGLGEELAPRLPVAVMSVGFLLLYGWLLKREFGGRAALLATGILGTSAAWLSLSHVGVTDLPLAATFSAAMLLGMRWVGERDGEGGSWAEGNGRGARVSGLAAAMGALLGLAVLAKGLVPVVLALPLGWMARGRLKALLHPTGIAAFAVVAAPWYLLCWRANGWRFIDEFFLQHHLGRFSTEALQHQQPFWFYAPVLLGGLFPWTPLVALLLRRGAYKEARRRFLLLWVVFGLVFFSAAVNKLPGYLLPLMPAVCALLGLELAEAKRAGWLLVGSALLAGMIPVAAALLPEVLLEGLRRAEAAGIDWRAAGPAAGGAVLAWWLERRGRRLAAAGAVVAVMIAGVVWVKLAALPRVDRIASARAFWRENRRRAGEICIEEAHRGWVYGLNYYAGEPLPECRERERPWRLRQSASGARLERGE